MENLYSTKNLKYMESDLAQEAIDAALAGDWPKAISLNSKILKINPINIDALNRIARAYIETGNIDKAQLTSKKVLKIDPINPIAGRCVAKWKNFKAGNKFVSPHVFIEEPNKTKTINLVNLGDISNLYALACGDSVKLIPHMHRLSVSTTDDKYIGRFPDDIALKFIKLLRNGRNYEALIKSADKTNVKVFIRSLN